MPAAHVLDEMLLPAGDDHDLDARRGQLAQQLDGGVVEARIFRTRRKRDQRAVEIEQQGQPVAANGGEPAGVMEEIGSAYAAWDQNSMCSNDIPKCHELCNPS